jgi:hypothetical protein
LLFALAVAVDCRRCGASGLGLRPLYFGFFVLPGASAATARSMPSPITAGASPMLWPFYSEPIASPVAARSRSAPTGLEFVDRRRGFAWRWSRCHLLPAAVAAGVCPRRGRWKAGQAAPSAAARPWSCRRLLPGVAQVALRRSALVSRLEAPVLQELALKDSAAACGTREVDSRLFLHVAAAVLGRQLGQEALVLVAAQAHGRTTRGAGRSARAPGSGCRRAAVGGLSIETKKSAWRRGT